jgi:hypothetical protein
MKNFKIALLVLILQACSQTQALERFLGSLVRPAADRLSLNIANFLAQQIQMGQEKNQQEAPGVNQPSPVINQGSNQNAYDADLEAAIAASLAASQTTESEDPDFQAAAAASLAASQTSETPEFQGFIRTQDEMGIGFTPVSDLLMLDNLVCCPLYQNPTNPAIIQLGVVPQQMDTCLWHALKNALLIESQIKGEYPFTEFFKLLDAHCNNQALTWREPADLDTFLETHKPQELLPHIFAVSSDLRHLRAKNITTKQGDMSPIKEELKAAQELNLLCTCHVIMYDGSAERTGFSHWYLMSIFQNRDGQKRYILADSKEHKENGDIIAANKDRTQDPAVMAIVERLQ